PTLASSAGPASRSAASLRGPLRAPALATPQGLVRDPPNLKRFFKIQVLGRDLGDHVLQPAKLRLGSLLLRADPARLPIEDLSRRAPQTVTPLVILIRRDPFAATQLCDLRVRLQAGQHDPHLLRRRPR